MNSVTLGLAAVLCAVGANGAGLSATALTPFDTQGYYRVRNDYRRCMAPLCGGWWVSLVNSDMTKCADGVLRKECYVAEIVTRWGAPFRLTLPTELLKGTLDTKVFGTHTLGAFRLAAAHHQASEAEGLGTFLAVKSNGIVCVTDPCPSLTAYTLNTKDSMDVSSVFFDDSLDAKMVHWAKSEIDAGRGVVLAGRLVKLIGTAGVGAGVSVNQIYRACPSGFALSNGRCILERRSI